MWTQSSVDAVYSTTYVDDYLDGVQDMPDDLQKHLSRIKEFDAECDRHVKEADRLTDILIGMQNKEENETDQKIATAISLKLQNLLIRTQKIGDEKLEIIQQLQDVLENKTRQLETDKRNSEMLKEPSEPIIKQEPVEKKRVRRARHDVFVRTSLGPPILEATSHTEQPVTESHFRASHSSTIPSTSHAAATIKVEHHVTSAQTGTSSSSSNQSQEKATHVKLESDKTSTTSTSTVAVKKEIIAIKKEKKVEAEKKKYKRRKTKQTGNSPPNLPIDPDEPTYCLCDQVSYGEMIGCDNDLCPIEWFHFSCVSLTTKPKGKWYCPKCRGDRPTIMKPKAVFLKELEKYNQMKEEKA